MKEIGKSYYALINKHEYSCSGFEKSTPFAIIYGKIVRIEIDEESTTYYFEFYSNSDTHHIITVYRCQLFDSREEAKKYLIDNIDELVIENI